MRHSQALWGTGEQKYLFPDNKGTKIYKRGEHGNKGNFGEYGTHEIKILMFGEQGNKAIYFRETREQVPTGGPHACPDN